MTQIDIGAQLGLRPVINVSGTMTALGASIVVPEAVAAVSAIVATSIAEHRVQRMRSWPN